MSGYRPRHGDRVRVVLEAEVRAAYPDGSFQVGESGSHNYINPANEHVTSVEKIAAALPTTPASVIRHEGCFLVLSTAGAWGCPDHNRLSPADADALAEYGFEVIFDAGAES